MKFNNTCIFIAANELENALDQVRWELEWLLAAHLSPNELVVMVGDPKGINRI